MAILVLSPGSSATTVIAPRFEALVDRSELIFTGQVLSQHAEWRTINGRKSIVTLVTYGVHHVHKGRAASTVTLQFLGGALGDVALDVTDMPKFKAGERVVLFVEGNGQAVSPVVGFYHGRFSLRRTEAGRDEVLTHNGESLASVADLGRAKRVSAPSARALSHEEFTAQIRARLATGETK